METFIKIAQLLLSLSLLIILHEFGHFAAARLFNTRVEKFFLFFDAWGKKLFSFKKGDTEYGIGWLPLGGYVKISGMIDESMDKEQMKLPAQPYEFRSKPAWQRLIIMLGGVFVNFVLGIFIYIMIVNVWGESYINTEGANYGYETTQTFKDLGFKSGDVILKINNETPFDVSELNKRLFLRHVETVTVKHESGETETISIPETIGKQMWTNGELQPFTPRLIPVLEDVLKNTPAEKAGLKKGDLVTKINGEKIVYTHEISQRIDSTAFQLSYERNGIEKTIELTPEYVEKYKRHQIGIQYDVNKSIQENHKDYSFVESIPEGLSKAKYALKDLVSQFKYVFTKKGATQVGGFIAIGKIFPATWNWQAFWAITAFLSIMLGFMNLLPIPALDGGHALFVLVEMITGRKPSDKFLEYAQLVGFAILMGLLLWANGNDLYKLIFK
jgi:regulator of sigma E protease